jgi:hypothetical protein
MGLKEWSFSEHDYNKMNWTRLNFLIRRRVSRLKLELYGYDFRSFYAKYMGNHNERYYFQRKYFKPSPNLEPMIKRREKAWLARIVPYKKAR